MSALFPRNVGTADRVARIVVGVALLALALTGRSAWGWLGVIPLATALVGSCPLYTLFGVRTCPVRRAT